MTTHTTTSLYLTWRDHARTWLAQRDPIALLSILLIVSIVGLAVIRQLAIVMAPIAAVPTPSPPIIMIATQPAMVPPTAAPRQVAAQLLEAPPRYVVAFAAPDGAVLGAIPEPAASAILARYGDSWLMTNWQGSNVWIRAADIGLNLADVAPALAPAVSASARAPVSAAPVAPEQPYQTDNAPPTPEPPAQPGAATVVAPAAQPAYPTLAPMEMNEVNAEWARQQYAAEHP